MQIGDNVRLLNEKGEGTIIRFISQLRAVVEIKGLEFEMPVKELVPVSKIPIERMRAVVKEPVIQKKKNKISKPHPKDELLVDLHIEKLREDPYGLDNKEKIDIQIAHFNRKLRTAANGHITKIVFIHGVGNGVLRQTIRDLLKGYDGIEYSDASYQKFGAGATEVRIISRNKFRASL